MNESITKSCPYRAEGQPDQANAGSMTRARWAMRAPEWAMEQWPDITTIISIWSHGIREPKPTDEINCNGLSLSTGTQVPAAARRGQLINRDQHDMVG